MYGSLEEEEVKNAGILIMVFGAVFFLIGLLIFLLPSLPRIPGDIVIKKKGFTLIFPLGTSILLSLILTLLLNFIFKGK